MRSRGARRLPLSADTRDLKLARLLPPWQLVTGGHPPERQLPFMRR